MSSDIVSNLKLDCKFTSSRLINVKEINGCDSSFIISCVLGHWIKNKAPVLFLSTHNYLTHYQTVGLKMNYNLQKQVESGLVVFYNIGEENVKDILLNDHTSIDSHFIKIKEQVFLLFEKYHAINVILDGVSHLFDLDYSLREVNTFCSNIIRLLQNYDNSFVFCHCNVASQDDSTHVIANLLSHKAQMVLDIETLPSGWSADVSGHLTIKYPGLKYEQEHINILEPKHSKYLFKLFDRGVKLFAPGTV